MLFVESQFMFVRSEFLLAKSRRVKTLCLLARSHFFVGYVPICCWLNPFFAWLDPQKKMVFEPTKQIGSQLLVKPIWRFLVG